MAYSPEKALLKSVDNPFAADQNRPSSRQSHGGNPKRILRQNIQIAMPEKQVSNKMDMLALGEMSLNEYLEETSQLDKDPTEQKQVNPRGPPSR